MPDGAAGEDMAAQSARSGDRAAPAGYAICCHLELPFRCHAAAMNTPSIVIQNGYASYATPFYYYLLLRHEYALYAAFAIACPLISPLPPPQPRLHIVLPLSFFATC